MKGADGGRSGTSAQGAIIIRRVESARKAFHAGMGRRSRAGFRASSEAAYSRHAAMPSRSTSAQNAAIQQALAFLASSGAKDVGAVLDKLLWLGGVNLRTMQLLSEAHASRWVRACAGPC